MYQLEVHGFARGLSGVGEACCTDSARVRLPSDGTGYVISFPVHGVLHAVQRGHELELAPGRAVVSQPPAEVVMTTGDDFDVIVVRVDGTALEDALEAQLGYPVRRPLPLAPTLDLDTATGREWAALVRYVTCCGPPVPGRSRRACAVVGARNGAPRYRHHRGLPAATLHDGRARSRCLYERSGA
jgi:hypothetical protein